MIIAAVSSGLPTLTVLVGILINNQRLSDLAQRIVDLERRMDQKSVDFEKRMDQRFADLRDGFRSELFRVEQVMDARLKHLEEHFER